MKSEDQKEIKLENDQNIGLSVDKSRRSFSKKGLVAPVIMTLANRSAWGANACVGSGFGSYSIAVTKPSHSALVPISGWKQPKNGLPVARDGWYELPGSWPAGFSPVHKLPTAPNPAEPEKIYTSPIGAWSSEKTIAEVLVFYPSTVVFVTQLGTGYTAFDPTLTIYDALNAGGNLAYELAGFLNAAQTPSTPFPLLGPGDYVLFYSNCVS
jgi:hypothetical protein